MLIVDRGFVANLIMYMGRLNIWFDYSAIWRRSLSCWTGHRCIMIESQIQSCRYIVVYSDMRNWSGCSRRKFGIILFTKVSNLSFSDIINIQCHSYFW